MVFLKKDINLLKASPINKYNITHSTIKVKYFLKITVIIDTDTRSRFLP